MSVLISVRDCGIRFKGAGGGKGRGEADRRQNPWSPRLQRSLLPRARGRPE